MRFSPYDYDKKSYRESKRRRKQALRQSETGVIKPYRRGNRTAVIAVCAAVALCVAVAAVLICRTLFVSSETAAATVLIRITDRAGKPSCHIANEFRI